MSNDLHENDADSDIKDSGKGNAYIEIEDKYGKYKSDILYKSK